MAAELVVRRILQDDVVDFACSDPDLTEFFQADSLNYLKHYLAVTYAIEYQGQTLAMFSLCNDRLDIHDFAENHKALKKAAKDLPHAKRGLRHFPAVKIARLAVKEGTERNGLGRAIVVFIQVFLLRRNKTGCRFLTVDSISDRNRIL